MKRKTTNYQMAFLAAALTFAGACSTMGQTVRETSWENQLSYLGDGEVAVDAELLIGVMRDIHPGYLRYRSESDARAAEQELRRSAADSKDVGSFFLAVSGFLAAIRCEHTEAELPVAISLWRGANPTMLPVRFVWVQNTAIIVAVAPGVSGIEIGDELMDVDGHSMLMLFEEMSRYISVDGFTDRTKASLFAGSDDVGLTTFDVYYPLLHGCRESFLLTVRSPNGDRRELRVPAVDERASLAARGLSDAQVNFSDAGAVSWRQRGTAAVLTINTFVNYRTPVVPDEVFGPVFKEIKKSGLERLVLDLRLVGGGSTDVMGSLLRHLIDKPITVGGPSRVKTYDFAKYREYLSTWDESVFSMPASLFTADGTGLYTVSPEIVGGIQRIEPAAEAWRGPLTVLIGPGNESGATILLAELLDDRQMTLIGQPTGGSAEGPTAGVIAFLSLPASQIVVRVPLLWTTTSLKGFVHGQGIAPDIEVPMTIGDVRAGRDPALDLAAGRK